MTGDEPTLLDEMIDVAMLAIRDGFQALWERPNAAAVLEDFLDRRAKFVIDRDGIDVLVKHPDAP